MCENQQNKLDEGDINVRLINRNNNESLNPYLDDWSKDEKGFRGQDPKHERHFRPKANTFGLDKVTCKILTFFLREPWCLYVSFALQVDCSKYVKNDLSMAKFVGMKYIHMFFTFKDVMTLTRAGKHYHFSKMNQSKTLAITSSPEGWAQRSP